jgi:putative nucleotidyltransferase with HDIG domain
MSRVICKRCNRVYEIPDEDIPRDRDITFACRVCKTPLKVDLGETSVERSENGAKEPGRTANPPKPDKESLKKKIFMGLTGNLPPMPQVVIKAHEVMSNPGAGLKELAKVIATDQAISIRILRLANSAYYGLSGKVTSIGQAVVLLGEKRLGEIMIMAGSLSLLGKTLRGYGMDSETFWQHSLGVAVAAKLIAKQKAPDLENEAFLAGLIHDAGKIMLNDPVHEKKQVFDALLEGGERNLVEVEKEVFGFDHGEMGAEVCKKWEIPESLTTAICYHHDPANSQDKLLTYIVHVADALVVNAGLGARSPEDRREVNGRAQSSLGIKEEELEALTPKVLQTVEKIAGEIRQ